MNVDYRLPLVLILLAFLLLSVGANYKFLKRNRHLTRELARVQLDPLGLNRFDDQPLPDENTDITTILFFGDSRAASWPNPSMGSTYFFVNRGVDGHTSAQTVQRLAAHVAPLKPDVVVVQVCVNDLRLIPVFPAEKEAIVAACQKNIRQIVAQSRALGATVLLTTIFPVQDPPMMERMYWSPDVYEGIDTVNDTIRSLAGDNVLVLDAYALLVNENAGFDKPNTGRLQSRYAADYLHINEAGYRVLNEALVKLLE